MKSKKSTKPKNKKGANVRPFLKTLKRIAKKKKIDYSKGKKKNTPYKRKSIYGDTIYDIYFPEYKKTKEDLIDHLGTALDKIKIKGKEFIKLTFSERYKNEINGLSYLYDIKGNPGLEDAIAEMLEAIFKPTYERIEAGYMRRIKKLKGYIFKLEIKIEK